MGEKSDSKKGSSPYVVLENRSLDQWKVTELKEELKKRKMMTNGLKADLVKRLDSAVRAEIDEAKKNLENDLKNEAEPEVVQSEDDAEETADVMDQTEGGNEGLEKDEGLNDKMVTEGEGFIVTTQVETTVSVETTVLVSENMGGQESQMIGNENTGLTHENGDPNPEEQPELGYQVDEVSQVQTDSISIDTTITNIENIEKNEIKDNVIADDDVKLEIDVKPSNSESVKVDEQHEDEPAIEEKDANIVENTNIIDKKDDIIADDVKENIIAEEKYVDITENVDICKKNDSGDAGSPEKLNLDGDDSMEEDILEIKQIDTSEKVEVKEDDNVNKSVVPGEDKMEPSVGSTKRKPYDQEGSENSEVVKRQRRWNSESVKVPEQLLPNHSASTTPKDAFPTLGKRTFSRSESTVSQDSPKERVVPPTSKAPTTSLRIDNFLRPFTLKAVQELLGKTGTVVSFWMDQIKTHCYVTYASVEEAIDTRNAVCNLQWPAYGGRLLMADFVDPQEVKNRVDPPPPSPAPPATTVPPSTTMQPPQPSPRQKQQLPPPPTLPPPPPLSTAPPPARARAPPPEKTEPLILTLDDLFKKTRATPRIYYLPLSDEQVAAKKMNASQGKPVKHKW